MSENNKNLYYLDELSDYKVASDDSDVRGWEVIDADNRTIGKVDRLLANKETERVVYLDVEVDRSLIEDSHEVYEKSASEGAHEFVNKEGENHLIIPIGLVKLDEENNKVISDVINYGTFAKTKRISKTAPINRKYEMTVLGHYSPGNRAEDDDIEHEKFYDRQEFKRSTDDRYNK
ncbi:PRC-barrel domain-containing protein [Algoriphagus sp. C2-6-M1]|uniref:PRC-barrel domain-containing protein n=1 Tax=Algoriphagus persicinus TaxID=3108754 RepID=UPI002B3CB387|nr:PRC-barrel domain-containing protein [Algoriphagus sp. C2-6-M1]MEB2782305.1 PRC-barrel domain-containing protein [Algoriphagus sp. C2-6-M1]